ncbi:MAG: M48 family metalloprotease, partial [Planctomycetota bacterium]|nr:M48 family metalloprotease [Planctomycetota bacterium]
MSNATNFFERQDDARRNTSWLVALFAVAVVLVILALSVPLFVNGRVQEGLVVGGVVGAVVLLASGFRLLQLRGGGRVVAEGLGGRVLPASTKDPAERRLLNVVEEMALASGIPAPPVYVMDDEMQINAFAAGLRPEDAVLGFTEGCMRRLPRDELQGVVAHEFSHIKHGDMRLNIRLMGLIFGLMALVYLGWTIIRIGFHSAAMARKKEDAGGLALVLPGLALVVVGGVGAFFGSLLKAMVSRQREYLADASAVQYTR